MNIDIIHPWLKCIYSKIQHMIVDIECYSLNENAIEELKIKLKNVLNCEEYEKLTEYSKCTAITLLRNQERFLADYDQLNRCFTSDYTNKLYSHIIKLVYHLQIMTNKNIIYGYESMNLPSRVLFMYDKETCKDRVIATAITAETRMLDFEIDDETKFIDSICKRLDNRHILSIYIPFIPHAELSDKIFSRYEVTNVKESIKAQLEKTNRVWGCICDMDILMLKGCQCNF